MATVPVTSTNTSAALYAMSVYILIKNNLPSREQISGTRSGPDNCILRKIKQSVLHFSKTL